MAATTGSVEFLACHNLLFGQKFECVSSSTDKLATPPGAVSVLLLPKGSVT